MQSQLERWIAELEGQYQSMLEACRADRAAYDEMLRRAACADQSAFDEEALRREMNGWRNALTRRLLLLDQVYRALETDRAALDALLAGRLLTSLREKMPDAAEIAALLDQTAEAAEGMRARQEAIVCAVREIGVGMALPAENAAVPDLADRERPDWIAGKTAGLMAPETVRAAERGRGS